MRVGSTVKIGLALVLLGTGSYFGIGRWMSTRIIYPLDMPISLAKGHTHTRPFRLNLRTSYMVVVAPNTEWQWEQAHPECNPYRHVQNRWVLYKDGKAVDRLDEPVTIPWSSAFIAGSGTYELDLEVLSDFSCADSAGPHLEIIADTDNYETGAFLLKAIAVLAVGLGAYMLTFLPLVRLVGSRERAVTISDDVTAGANFQRERRLPLRRPIVGLPAFGLLAGMVFAILAIVVILLTGSLHYTPKGLWVHLQKPGEAPEKSDLWTEALIVRLEDEGVGREPKLFVNAKPVNWDDLDRTLREELARRQKWVVYVQGDSCMAWQNAVTVIATARADGATVFLLTGNPEKDCGQIFHPQTR